MFFNQSRKTKLLGEWGPTAFGGFRDIFLSLDLTYGWLCPNSAPIR